MSQFTTAESTLHVCATAPATANTAGYEALTWTAVGEVIDLGEIGESINVVNSSNVSSGYAIKLTGLKDAGDQALQVATQNNDAGVELLRTAKDGRDLVFVKLTSTQVGVITYYPAYVTNFKESKGGVESVQITSITLSRTPYLGVVEVRDTTI